MTRNLAFISIHPDFIASYLSFGVMASAKRQAIVNFHNISLRDYAIDRHGSIDAPPYGGGDGMVMRIEPLTQALAAVREQLNERALVVCPSPQGKLWNHQSASQLAEDERDLIFICGRFAGIDQRFLDRSVDLEFSLGDFVISGGELAALTMADSVLRLLPGALGHAQSGVNDSFAAGMKGRLEQPLYTKPPVFEGQEVPAVLLSGDHRAIEKWRQEMALEATRKKRPDLL
ncbi:MAG: tRNA (guanosine(37)-N1)-methyltransferase TrmD [Oligoflexus sp.]